MRKFVVLVLALSVSLLAPSTALAAEAQEAPAQVVARAGVNEATVRWDAAASATSYTATANPGGRTCTTTATTCAVTGLSNGQPYTFSVVATGPDGASDPSASSAPVVPQTDTTRPVLISSTVTPQRVSSLGGTVRVDLHIADDLSGLRAPSGALDANPAILFKDAAGKSFGFTRTNTRISGDKYDGVYRYTVNVPAGTPAGSATLTVYPIDDAAGNRTSFIDRPGIQVGSAAAPSDVVATATPARNAILTWTAPTDDGGNVITGYNITEKPSGRTFTAPADVQTLDVSLTNPSANQALTYEVSAKNAGGSSPAGISNALTIPAAAPKAPSSPEVTIGDQQLTASWTAPAVDGGSSVTGYTATATPSGATCESAAPRTACTIRGLSNGTAYTIAVTATNVAGTSDDSAPSAPATPATGPDQVAVPAAVARANAALVTWNQTTGRGSPVTGYTVTASPGGKTCTAAADGTSCAVIGLTNGTVYTFTVSAHSAVGSSSPSAPSASVTPVDVPTTPGKPTLTAGDKRLTVKWAAADANGSTITGYIVTLSDGKTCNAAPEARSCNVTGLVNGKVYTATVRANNKVGSSATSAASSTAAPYGRPATAARPTAKPGKKSATVTWKAPFANGSTITGYVIIASNGKKVSATAGKRSVVVTGLTKGRKYTFRVAAKNKAGQAAYSSSSTSVKIK